MKIETKKKTCEVGRPQSKLPYAFSSTPYLIRHVKRIGMPLPFYCMIPSFYVWNMSILYFIFLKNTKLKINVTFILLVKA